MGELKVGCAGWHYPDLVGTLYPRGLPESRWLEHYARLFPFVEVNATFYALPDERTVRGWIERVASEPRFGFSVALSQEATHIHLALGRIAEARAAAARFVERVVRPLEDSGRFEAILVQLPPTFDAFGNAQVDDPAHALAETLETLEPRRRRVAVEFRHPSWFDHVGERLSADAETTLAGLRAGLVRVDGLGFRVAVTRTTEWTYFRFHGRRTQIPAHERGLPQAPYDYRYKKAELEGLAAQVQRVAAEDRATLVAFNNHYRGQAARNALELRRLLGLPVPEAALTITKQPRLDDFLDPAKGLSEDRGSTGP